MKKTSFVLLLFIIIILHWYTSKSEEIIPQNFLFEKVNLTKLTNKTVKKSSVKIVTDKNTKASKHIKLE